MGLIDPLNAELNPICHLLTLVGSRHIVHVSRIRVKADLRKRVGKLGVWLYVRIFDLPTGWRWVFWIPCVQRNSSRYTIKGDWTGPETDLDSLGNRKPFASARYGEQFVVRPSSDFSSCDFRSPYACMRNRLISFKMINPLRTKRSPFYLKPHLVPRSKHLRSHLLCVA